MGRVRSDAAMVFVSMKVVHGTLSFPPAA